MKGSFTLLEHAVSILFGISLGLNLFFGFYLLTRFAQFHIVELICILIPFLCFGLSHSYYAIGRLRIKRDATAIMDNAADSDILCK